MKDAPPLVLLHHLPKKYKPFIRNDEILYVLIRAIELYDLAIDDPEASPITKGEFFPSPYDAAHIPPSFCKPSSPLRGHVWVLAKTRP